MVKTEIIFMFLEQSDKVLQIARVFFKAFLTQKEYTFETILVTCVTLHVTHQGGYTFSQKYMSLALMVEEGM